MLKVRIRVIDLSGSTLSNIAEMQNESLHHSLLCVYQNETKQGPISKSIYLLPVVY